MSLTMGGGPLAAERSDRSKRSNERTPCPYKGNASYLSPRDGSARREDVAFSYERPLDEARRLAGAVHRLGEAVEVSVGDG